MPVPEIQTPRLLLTGHVAEDFEPLAAVWADLAVVRHIGGKPSSRQESWSRILRYRGLWPIMGYGYWAIRERQTGRYVGDVGFADFEREAAPSIRGIPEAGWVLATEAHGKGYASEALSAALAWLDGGNRFAETVCLIEHGNAASRRVAEKNGFVFTQDIVLGDRLLPLFHRACTKIR